VSVDSDSMPILDFAAVVRLVLDRSETFLRYSAGPKSDLREGPSRDFEAGVNLPGWSVTTITPEPWCSGPPEDWIARCICKFAEPGSLAAPGPPGQWCPVRPDALGTPQEVLSPVAGGIVASRS
jgi:hypothetical protein